MGAPSYKYTSGTGALPALERFELTLLNVLPMTGPKIIIAATMINKALMTRLIGNNFFMITSPGYLW
jgi:hypothetical protein